MAEQPSKVGDKFYRYFDPYNAESVRLYLEEFVVKRLTPKGYWINHADHYPDETDKFVLHNARRRYAYPTKELALESYIIRKQKQLGHLASAKAKAEHGLFIATELKAGRVPKSKGGYIDFFAIHGENDQ